MSIDTSVGDDAALVWAAAHLPRPVIVEPLKDRPWGRTWRLVTADGPAYLKAASPANGYEAALLPALVTLAGDRLPAVLASDPASGRLLLADAGPVLGLMRDDAEPVAVRHWVDLVRHFAELQRTVAPLTGRLAALGVPDERTARIPDLLDDVLATSPSLADLTGDERRRLHALRPRWQDAAAQLDSLGIPASVQHGDLHPSNVTVDGAGRMRFIDFGDASLAHAFTTLLVPLRVAADRGLDHADLTRLRESYLEVWSDLAPMPALRRGLDTALDLARILRATSWDRALRAAPGDPDWGDGLVHWLREILDRY